MIYAAHILEGQFIKIGYCKNSVEARIAGLQTGCPFEIKKLFTVDGSLTQEKELHKALARAISMRKLRMPPNERYIGSHEVFMGFLCNFRESVNIGLAYLDDLDDYDYEERQSRYEMKLFKYGTKESIEEYIKKGPKRNRMIVWPRFLEASPRHRALAKELVEFFQSMI